MATKRRLRRIFGTVALFAFLFSLAEAGVASTCAPMAGIVLAETESHLLSVATPEHSEHPPAITDAPADEGHLRSCARLFDSDDSERAPHCPWNPTMGPGCVTPVSLRATPPADLPVGPEREAGAFPDLPGPSTPPADRLFHPPR